MVHERREVEVREGQQKPGIAANDLRTTTRKGVDSVAVASARALVLVRMGQEYVPRVDRSGYACMRWSWGPPPLGGHGDAGQAQVVRLRRWRLGPARPGVAGADDRPRPGSRGCRGDRPVRRLRDRRRAHLDPPGAQQPGQGPGRHHHLRLRPGAAGRHGRGRAGVRLRLGRGRPGPAKPLVKILFNAASARSPWPPAGSSTTPLAAATRSLRPPCRPGRGRAGLYAGQPPPGQHRDQPRPGPAHPPGAAPRRPAPGAGQLGHGAGPGPGGGGGGRAEPAAAAGPDPAPGRRLPGLQGRGAGQARPGRGRGGGRAPAPAHHPGAGGRPPAPGGRPAQGRPDRHRLP